MADWPKEIHQQYLLLLDERDELQMRIELLEKAIWKMMALPATERREMKSVGRKALNGEDF